MADKEIKVVNKTGYELSNIVVSHAISLTEPHGDKVLNHDGVLKDGASTSKGKANCQAGLIDYWYVAFNILIPKDKWKLHKVDNTKLEDGKLPLMMSNSKGWKKCNLMGSDKSAEIILGKNEMNGWDDIKLNGKIHPSHTSDADFWAEVSGHGGEAPQFALTYPAIPVGAALIGLTIWGFLGGISSYTAYLLAEAAENSVRLATLAAAAE